MFALHSLNSLNTSPNHAPYNKLIEISLVNLGSSLSNKCVLIPILSEK